MDLDDYKHQLTEPYWLDDVAAVRVALAANPLAKRQFRSLSQYVCNEIERGRLGRATNWAVLGFLADPHRMLSDIRRSGAFRCSHYAFNRSKVASVVRPLLGNGSELGFSTEQDEYLRSIEALTSVAEHVARINQGLVRKIRSERGLLLKGLLAQVELLFAYPREPDRTLSADEPDHYSMEEFAEAFSYIYYLHISHFGLQPHDLVMMDANRVAAGEHLPLLVGACIVRRFREWEVQVDSLGYRCRREAKGVFVFDQPDERLEKAIRFGFVQSEMRGQLVKRQAHASGTFGVEKAARSLSKAAGSRASEIVDEPIRRICCQFPLVEKLKEMISTESIFEDEAQMIAEKARTYLTPVHDLLNFEAADGVKTIDLVRVQRLVNFIRFYSLDSIDRHRASDPALVAQSILPAFGPPDLLELLKAAVPEDTAEAVIRLLHWPPTGDTVFDLQYQPLVGGDPGAYLIPMSVFGSSDIIRNAMQLSRRRIESPEDETEPMCSLLVDALRPHSEGAESNLPYTYSGQQGEIDTLAVLGRVAFAFECKNPLLPATPHEMRTTLDHLWKASRQLASLSAAWTDPAFRENLLRRIGINAQDVDELVPCVVTSNRMYSGARVGGHPVLSLFELVAFVNDGEVKVAEFPVRLRRKGALSSYALRGYVANDSVHRPTFAAMVARAVRHNIGDAIVREETFALDAVLLAENFGFRPTREQWEQILEGRHPFLPSAGTHEAEEGD